MKGMHGVCLHPGRAVLELKVRAYNRTPLTQTFLWWANVATRVHEQYQSFFPPDVYYVADHARRSMSEYPLAKGFYYGVNYGERGRTGVPEGEKPVWSGPAHRFEPPHFRASNPLINGSSRGDEAQTKLSNPENLSLLTSAATTGSLPDYAPNDLSFYANIPVPTSYMCMGSQEDFFGGYDYFAQAGIVHVANHHISPGKKQWTWGNHEFGYAWDRNLTEPDAKGEYGPYIEIMAGVYTDNQPDFSFLQPGETKTWSQYWYPIQKIGPAQHANLEAAVSLQLVAGQWRLGVAVTRAQPQAVVTLTAKGKTVAQFTRDLSPSAPLVELVDAPKNVTTTDWCLRVVNAAGQELIVYQPKPLVRGEVPPPATEPPAPADIASTDELFITGLHLEQYRHATRCPTLYWREALRWDPLDSRCNLAMGRWHLRRGEFALAEASLRRAIERLTRRNANPYDGEAYYHLGLCLRHLGREEEAYAVLYNATWNQAWAGAGYHALAEIDATRQDWTPALEHLNQSLRLDTDNLRARNLRTMVLRQLGRKDEAAAGLRATRALDVLDDWSRYLAGETLSADLQARLDLAHDLARAGFYAEAVALLDQPELAKQDMPDQSWGARPLVFYTQGWLAEIQGNAAAARGFYQRAAREPADYCFPARLEEIAILEAAMRANPRDARAPYYLGNLLYDRRRHAEAIQLWERSAKLDGKFSIVWRNLGIGYFNIARNAAKAVRAYDAAIRVNPADARLWYERDQLWKRLGKVPKARLAVLAKRPELVAQRDDLSLELVTLYNQCGQPAKALAGLTGRHFQPWEGGEGGPLGQYTRAHLMLGQAALAKGDAETARQHFTAALTVPKNLCEARHLLANQSDLHYWLGRALDQLGETAAAREEWLKAATFTGDFQEMSVRPFSEMTYYSAQSWRLAGQKAKAQKLLKELLAYGRNLENAPAKIDYFATSLPTMLLFEDDPARRQKTTALFLQAQAQFGLGQAAQGRKLLQAVLKRDPNHALAADFATGAGKS